MGVGKNRRQDMEAFKGKFERVAATNYEELLKLMDVSFLLRKAATVSTPVMEISEDGGTWTMKTSTTLKAMELEFKLGEKFDETTADGREVSSVVTFDAGKIVTVQTAKKAGVKSTKSVRELQGDSLLLTITVEGSDLVSTQTFKRV